jgi:hypothetical protein
MFAWALRARASYAPRALSVVLALAFGLAPRGGSALECVHPMGNRALSPLGDATGSGAANVADAVCAILTGLWFSEGAQGAPPPCLGVDPYFADANCDGVVDISDVLIVVNVVLQGTPPAALSLAPDGCPLGCQGCAAEGSSCLIAGACVPEGASPPDDACALCQPSDSEVAYTVAPDGLPCGGGSQCQGGVCGAILPTEPLGVLAAGGPNQVTVSWTAPSSDGGAPIDAYVVRVFAEDGGPAQGTGGDDERITSGPALELEFAGLLPFVPYRFTVAAINEVGEGPPSLLSEAATPQCSPCGPGSICEAPSDCDSGVCDAGVCAAASCHDGVQNGGETDEDCGGPCPPCGTGLGCAEGPDCAEGVCAGGECGAPTCSDGVSNGDETGVDCGGPLCSPCQGGQGCLVNADCATGECGPGLDGTCIHRLCRPGPLAIPGGTLRCQVQGADVYEICRYHELGSHSFTPRHGVTHLELLVVAGGGGGGSSGESGSGGGAGGLAYYGPQSPRLGTSYFAIPEEPIAVFVGAGGVGARVADGTSEGEPGEPSSFGDVIAVGGGEGVGANQPGRPGGSGSGACDAPDILGGAALQPTSASGGFGHPGGASTWHGTGASGGGGASAPGGVAVTGGSAGHGGAGLSYATSGQPTFYSGGGGGGFRQESNTAPGLGGAGGGGTGGTLSSPAGAGAPNTGGGGGGAYGLGSGPQPDTDAGAGGSGVVIVRYPVPACDYLGTCGIPTCDDGLLNGDETDVDCGGPCAPCGDGLMCAVVEDCESGVCGGGLCAAPACDDGVFNGAETDVDCGGPCAPCASGLGCHRPADCQSGICAPAAGTTCETRACSATPVWVGGAEVSCLRQGALDYEVHRFAAVGEHSFTPRDGVTSLHLLVVAGGGGGGSSGESGSGGGAGGVVHYGPGNPTQGPPLPVAPGVAIAVEVGAGGQGASVALGTSEGTAGGDSRFGNLVAVGGGRGVGANVPGQPGGSGSGACDAPALAGGPALQPGSLSSGFGHPGGSSYAHAIGGSGLEA